ncbi:MAG: Fic family protein [Elusimicrobia bacterium]|nr:Fic family protein [Elusimicrobiota bacterium]
MGKSKPRHPLGLKSPDKQLAGTPYSIVGDKESVDLFYAVQDRSRKICNHALRVQQHIASQATEILQPYEREIRASLVAESNRIENYDWSADMVSTVAATHKELMSRGLHFMLTALKGDPRVYQAIGLYKAHELAEAWADEGLRPNAAEVRALHQLVSIGEDHAGRYKLGQNWISGSSHRPATPIDAQSKMHDMIKWWQASTNDPILDATVVHAWLTHIHPFEDGNGRLARLLANLTLIQSQYPPLLLRHDSDRGRYYDALTRSDDGDILPLYDLFAQVIRRTTTLMGKPEYVHDIIKKRLLSNRSQSHAVWQATAVKLFEMANERFHRRHWHADLMGTVDLTAYSLIIDRNSDGNTWHFVVSDQKRRARWLAWFGYNTRRLLDLSTERDFPSMYLSVRDDRPHALHPYRKVSGVGGYIDEVVISPLRKCPVIILHSSGYCREYALEEAADLLVEALAGPAENHERPNS